MARIVLAESFIEQSVQLWYSHVTKYSSKNEMFQQQKKKQHMDLKDQLVTEMYLLW